MFKRNILYIAIALLLGVSQNIMGADVAKAGKISGTVLDKSSGETLIGVPVMVEGTTLGAVTDLDGKYLITGVGEGTYVVVFRYIGYVTKRIENVKVSSGNVTTVDVSLESNSQQLQEVTVTADMKRESIGSVLLMQKKSATVQDGISSEAIKRTPDKNTSEVVRRVSGASVQEGKFVVIRGLNDRYNGALLNGVPLASTEPDRKAFSFDLFPSNLLDNLIIVKTASPELPGEFAGGMLQVNTRDIPDQGFIGFTAGTSYNTQSTFKSYQTYEGGKTDWLGVDDGTRDLPSGFPGSEELKSATQQEKIEYSRQLPNDWAITEKASTPLAQNYQLSFGTAGKVKGNDLGMIGAVSYNNSRRTIEVERSDYDFDGQKNYDYTDAQYRENVNLGAILNLTYKISDRHKISLKNVYSNNATDLVVDRVGTDYENLQANYANALWYTSTKFFNSVLSGDHSVNDKGLRIKWNGGYTKINQDVPDLRRMYYYRNIETGAEDTSVYAYVPFGTASPNYAGKFYSELQDHIYFGEANASLPLHFIGKDHSVKFGIFEQYKDRSFNARVLGYVVTNPGQFNWDLLHEPQATIFDQSHMGTKGFRIDEITNPSDQYTASANLHAGYVQLDNLINDKFRFVWGVRVENFVQKLNSFGYSNDTVKVNTNTLDFLPSMNFTWSLTEKTNVRVAISQTVARPEFRELAPFTFYDFSNATSIAGNAGIERTKIFNADLRYEWYPTAGEIISASVFYKNFDKPIEPVVEASGAGSRRISYQNANSAYLYGVELEWRKNLGFTIPSLNWNQLENFTVYGNIAVMKSRVDVSNDLRSTGERALQGQSPYVFNAGLQYQEGKSGIGVNLVYNRIGTRIFQVGNEGYLNILEAPRDLVDLQISKRIMERGEIRFGINDLLNQANVFYQDQNGNDRYDSSEDSRIASAVFGTNYSLSVSYKF